MKVVKILILLLIFSLSSIKASTIDSLLNLIKTHNNDSLSLKAYNKLINIIGDKNEELTLKLVNYALVASKKQKNEFYTAFFSSILADKYELSGNYNDALKYYEESLNIYQKLDSLKKVADIKNNIGRVYEKKSLLDKAMTYYFESLKIREKINDKKGIASSYNSIGLINYYLGNYVNALDNFYRSLSIIKELKHHMGLATVYNNIGLVYIDKNQYDSALSNFTTSLKFYEQIEYLYGIATSYLNIAICLYGKNDLNTAEKYFLKSIEIKNEIGDKLGLISAYISLSVLYQKKELFNKAIHYVQKAINLGEEIENIEGLSRAYHVLSEIYKQTGNYKLAYETFVKHNNLKDSIINENSTKIINSLQEQFEAEKRKKDIQLANSKIKQQSLLIYGAAIVIALILSLTIIIFRNYRQRKRANILLSKQNEEISKQKDIIQQRNKDILDSITYAKRIQEAILPPVQYMSSYLKNMFVFFKPKDIVSGDFYWFVPVDDTILFAVVDCTGHGVPGAFMSIVGYISLNQIIKEKNLIEPGEILNNLNELVQQALRTSEQEIKDGMDIALCALNTKTKVLKFAGANNPLYIIRSKNKNSLSDKKLESDNFVVYEVKANKQPIGAHIHNNSFNTNELHLSEGDTIYIFSDGYADQFGGSKGKKLKYKMFKEKLIEIQQFEMNEQKKHLHLFFDEWKGEFEQVDDVCVMGVKV